VRAPLLKGLWTADVLVIGSGPAAWPSPVASAPRPALRWPLGGRPHSPLGQHLGVWAPKLEAQGLHLLEHRLVERKSAISDRLAVAHQHDTAFDRHKAPGPLAWSACEQGHCAGTAASPTTISHDQDGSWPETPQASSFRHGL